MAWLIGEDHVETTPECASEACKCYPKPEYDTQGDEVAQSLGLQEAGKRIALHCLEDVFLRTVEDFRVVSSLIFDSMHDLLKDRLRKDDFPLGTREEEGVEDLLGTRSDVRPCNGVPGTIGVGLYSVGGCHETRSRRSFGR